MMQDRKALQAGTSHFLGQNFARAFGIKFQTTDEKEAYAWTTSWGVSTRLIGGLIMSHADDDGLVLPPKVASAHVVLMPIIRNADDRPQVMAFTENLAKELKQLFYHHRRLKVEVDDRDVGGARGWDWIKKGIPLRVEIGPRDITANSVYVGRRDKSHWEKSAIQKDRFIAQIIPMLDDIQNALFKRAEKHTTFHTAAINGKQDFYRYFTPENIEKPEIHGGFALSHWCGSQECETKIKEDLSATIRCIPFDEQKEQGACVGCGKTSQQRVVFAKAY
jgi:prolyl-tRNA synthetase